MRSPSDHVFDRERAGTRIHARVSLRTAPPPPGGRVLPEHRIDDLLAPPAPSAHDPRWCVPGPEILGDEVRVEESMLVSAGATGIEVEDRLSVTTRALAPIIETERQLFADGKIGALAKVTHGVATAPDKIATHWRRAAAFLATKEGRAKFRHGLVVPHDLDDEQKAVTLFVGLSALLLSILAVHLLITLLAPDLARGWRDVLLLYGYAFIGSLGAPLPLEPAVFAASVVIGAVGAIVVTLAAKVAAAWLAFFLGDAVNVRLRARAAKRPWIAKALDASEAFARRFGLWAIALFIAVPGLPDAIALYGFGTLRMPLWKYLVGVAIGGAILYSAIVFGVARLWSR